MKKHIFICFLFVSLVMHTKSAVIIVHGTWASGESWYQPGGNFFQSVHQTCQELSLVDKVVGFTWSGGLNSASHYTAAERLAVIIREYDFVILIGHSHGGTVAVLASKILAKNMQNFGKIQKLYTLGMPITYDMSVYPDMHVIQHCYNLFSFGDFIQRINGMYTRAFTSHERLANIAIMVHDWYPTHSGMHSPVIGRQLLKIHDVFAHNGCNNFEQFDFLLPAQIKFFESDLPLYTFQPNQRELLDIDLKAQWVLNTDVYRRSAKFL